MLYLIRQPSKDFNYLKIGYTLNLEERLKAYNTHNANFELIESFEGERDLESYAHNLLKSLKIKGEWYKESSEVLLIWEMVKQEKRIREHENKIKILKERINEIEKEIESFNKFLI